MTGQLNSFFMVGKKSAGEAASTIPPMWTQHDHYLKKITFEFICYLGMPFVLDTSLSTV